MNEDDLVSAAEARVRQADEDLKRYEEMLGQLPWIIGGLALLVIIATLIAKIAGMK